jgi:hypothetical protein
MTLSRFACTVALAALATGALLACGASGTPTTVPSSSPTSAAAQKPAPAGTASAQSAAGQAKSRVDLLEGKVSEPPQKLPVVRLEAPGADSVVAAHYAQDYRVRFNVSNFEKMPEGSFVQLVLDGVPFRPVRDLKAAIKLRDLVEAGRDIAEGEHVLAVYVARPNREAIRAEKGIGVSRFWVGKRTTDSWKPGEPLLVVGSPSGGYEGEAGQEIVLDYYVINAVLGTKEHSIRTVLQGPGIAAEGISRLMTEWKPVLVWSAPAGSYTIEAALLDPQGKPVNNPWNPVKRPFTVTASR